MKGGLLRYKHSERSMLYSHDDLSASIPPLLYLVCLHGRPGSCGQQRGGTGREDARGPEPEWELVPV